MIRIGILGAGRVVQHRYLEVFRDELKDVKVTVVCDNVKERAENIATQLDAEAVFEMDRLLESKNIDAVLIATESGNHYAHATKVLEAGKHVIVEKPPALIPEEILKNEQYAMQNNLMYAVIFQNRLNPAMRILKKEYENGRFGKLVLATIRLRWCRYQDYYEDGWHGTWEMDGGVINQQAIHHIDALQWVCGSITDVCASQSQVLNELEAEDTTVAIVKFENGALGVIEATTAARPDDFEASISVVGEKGIGVIGGIALNKIDTWRFVEEKPEDKNVPGKYSQDVPTGYGLSHGPLVQEIVNRLNSGQIDPPITGSNAVPTVQLVHALYRSAEIGGWVKMADRPISERLGKG
ncbi:MAG: Gfo/Idh/MocA family oxidoreductase [Deltaproteobacteria bacterium]|nr:Gfo/Idh/MocA family oxidoreductase [Deltaproteobacteria bacterium]